MANWRLAESLKQLRVQLNAQFPERDKKSDGSVGDLSHSKRKSDHNPNSRGVVTAIDVTHNPQKTINCFQLAEALQKSKDPRIKYLIFNSKITVQGDISKWKSYSGANAHKHHLHISVSSDPALYDSRKAWNLQLNSAVTPENSPPATIIAKNVDTEDTPTQPADSPPITETITETTKIETSKETGQITVERNEQDVKEPASVDGIRPYKEIGFQEVVKKDLTKVGVSNGFMQTANQYREDIQAWGIPAKIIFVAAMIVLGVSVIYLLARGLHYLMWIYKEKVRMQLQAEANTNINKKDLIVS
jgi:hypothetical protein